MTSINIKDHIAETRKKYQAYAVSQGDSETDMIQAGGIGSAIDPIIIQTYYTINRTEGCQTIQIFKQDPNNAGHFFILGTCDDGNIFKPGGVEVDLTQNGASGSVTVTAPVLASVSADLGPSASTGSDVTVQQVGFPVGTVLF